MFKRCLLTWLPLWVSGLIGNTRRRHEPMRLHRRQESLRIWIILLLQRKVLQKMTSKPMLQIMNRVALKLRFSSCWQGTLRFLLQHVSETRAPSQKHVKIYWTGANSTKCFGMPSLITLPGWWSRHTYVGIGCLSFTSPYLDWRLQMIGFQVTQHKVKLHFQICDFVWKLSQL